MSEEKLVPKLRFVEDNWDSKKLGNLCKITMGQSPSSSNYSENEDDTILIQNICIITLLITIIGLKRWLVKP